MILKAVFLLSLSSLAFEILLVRVFSIGQWNHLSFMVISIALFGFGASGTFLSLLDARGSGWEGRLSASLALKTIALLYAVSVLASFGALRLIPLDYFRLPVEPLQIVYLFVVYLLLATPFFFSGMTLSLAYAHMPQNTGRIYLTTMVGSAGGAAIPFLLIPLLGEAGLILLIALVPLGLTFGRIPPPGKADVSRRPGRIIQAVSCLMVAGGVLLLLGICRWPLIGSILDIRPSSYKGLSHVLQFPDTRVSESQSSLRGRIDRVEGPHFHYAPGLSLKYQEPFPRQSAVFRDGDDRLILYHPPTVDPHQSPEGSDYLDFARYTLSYAGYQLLPEPERVLVVQRAGGIAIPCARAAGAVEITVLAHGPQIARIVSTRYGLPAIDQHPRSYLAGSGEQFDVIHVENWGSSLPGSAVLNQEHLFTIETIAAYLSHLRGNGILIFSRRLHLPPSDMVRLWATVKEGLETIGITDPEDHVRILRNWDTFTLVVSVTPLRDEEALQRFARDMNFDWVYARGLGREGVNRYSVFDRPYYYLEVKRLSEAYLSNGEDEHMGGYILDVSPQSDRRPFPNRFLKWSRLKDLYHTTGSRFYTLFMSGEIIVSLVFVEALILSVLLLVIPLFFSLRAGERSLARKGVYFLSVGAGFMFLELYFIKSFILLFDDPAISLTVVLSAILVYSGIGGFLSQWIGIRFLRYILVGLVFLLALILYRMDDVIVHTLRLPPGYQYLVALLLLLPTGLLIGLPFTLGMQHLLRDPVERAYAWAVNGCASVLASIASAQIALSLGIPAIIFGAICAYILAFLSTGTSRGTRRLAPARR